MKGIIPKEYMMVWEEFEQEFKDKIIKDSLSKIEKIEAEENPMSLWDMIEVVEKDPDKYRNVKGKVDADLIMLKLEIG